MVNKEVAQFIRACTHGQLLNSCSHEAQHVLQTIESDNPFDVVFIDFWEPGDIPDQVWISQDTHVPVLYDRVWARSIYWN